MTASALPTKRPRETVAAIDAMRAIAAGGSSDAALLLRALLGAAPGREAGVDRFLSMRRASCLRRVREALDTVPAFWATLLADATGATIEGVIGRAGLVACGEACRHEGRPHAALMLALGAEGVAASQLAAEAAAWPARAGRVLASLTLDLARPLADSGLRGEGLVRGVGMSLLASAWRRLDPRHAPSLAAGSLTNLPRHLEACAVFKRHLPDDEWACLKRLMAGASAEVAS